MANAPEQVSREPTGRVQGCVFIDLPIRARAAFYRQCGYKMGRWRQSVRDVVKPNVVGGTLCASSG